MNLEKFIIKAMKLKLLIFKNKCGPYYFTKILQKEGIDIGLHTIFYNPRSQVIDRERPWMLKIGDYCKITAGTTILCHDYSRSVIRRAYGDVIGEAKETIIGDNVFIGVNSTILMGTHIGSNVIVGAGSVVSGTFPDNCVIAGNPAKVIRSLDEHYAIRKEKTKEEAKVYYTTFVDKYKREPSEAEMGPFFPLFMERSRDALKEKKIKLMFNGDESEDVVQKFLQTTTEFGDFDEFKKWAREIERR